MRIAFFHELPPGGAKKAVEEFGKALRIKNISADLYYINEKRERSSIFSQEYYYKFTPKKWTGNNWKVRLYKDTIELHVLKKLHQKIAKEIDRKKYDFVFVHSSKYTQSPFILQYLRTYSVYYCHDPHLRIAYEKVLAIKSDLPLSRKIYEKVNRIVRKKIDRTNILSAGLLLANSHFTKNAVKMAYSVDAVVSYLGVDEKVFTPTHKKKESDVLFIGSTDEVDGYYDLLATEKYLSGTNVRVLDFKNNWIRTSEAMAEMYNQAKIVICLAYNEPFGLVPLEAMACGIPVIAVNDGGYKETIIHNKTGYLLRRDPKAFAEKIKFLLENKELAKIMGKEGRKNIEKNWTWEKSIDSLLNSIRSNK